MFPKDEPYYGGFSVFVIFVLCMEMLSPFSFAQSFAQTGAQDSASTVVAVKSVSFASTPTPTPAPIAKATTPSTVTSSGACTVSQQSGSEVKLIWDSTLGFVGNEVNSLSDSALKTSDSTAFTNATNGGQVIVNNYISTGSSTPANTRVSVADVARLLGKSTDEVANDFAVDPTNGTISMQMFQAEADKNPALSGFLGSFSSLLSSSTLSNVDAPAYTNYKIKLPNQKTLSLSDVLSMEDLNGKQQACLLDSSFIQGRVSYVAELDKDLSVGFDRSSTALKSNQHLTAESTIAALSLNGGGSIVVPKRFQNLVSALSTIMTIDTVFNIVESAYMIAQFKDYSKKMKDDPIKKENRDLADTKLQNAKYTLFSQSYGLGGATAGGAASVEQLFGETATGTLQITNRGANQATIFSLLDNSAMFKDSKAFTAKLDEIETAIAAEKTATGAASVAKIAELDKRATAVKNLKYAVTQAEKDGALDGTPNAITAFLNNRKTGGGHAEVAEVLDGYNLGGAPGDYVNNKLSFTDQDWVYENRYSVVSQGVMDNQDAIRNVIEGKLMSNFYFGFAWLGAGRAALSLARSLTLTSTGKIAPDNYLTIYINRNDVLSEFRTATDWALSGKILETISSFTGFSAPREAFGVGPMIFINSPYTTTDIQATADSSTILEYQSPESGYSASWQVTSNWKGKSDATVFEDVRDDPKYARMPLYVSNMSLGTALNQNDIGPDLYGALGLLFPIISFKLVGSKAIVDSAIVPVSRILVYDLYVRYLVDPTAFSKNDVCSDERVANYISEYAAATALSQASNIAQISLGAEAESWAAGLVKKMKGTLNTKAVNALNTISGLISPAELLKNYFASQGLEYTRTCKDTDYTIVGYQELDKKPKNSLASLTQKLNPIQSSSLVGNLSFGDALKGVGNSISTDAKTEIINTRMTMDSQSGMLEPSDLYYLHLDGASEVSWGIYNSLEKGGCFRTCEDGTTMAVCQTDSGTYLIDKKTGAKTQLSDRDRALMSTLMQDIAKTLIPNTLVSAQLACGSDSVMLQARTDAHVIGTPGCATVDCLVSQLAALSGSTITGDDIGSVMGEVSAVKTTTGIALFEAGKPIRFIFTAGTQTTTTPISPLGPGYYSLGGIPISENSTQVTSTDIQKGALTQTKSKVGTEVQSPSVDAVTSVDNGTLTNEAAYESAFLNVKGDASVTLSGFTSGTNYKDVDAGQLESIIFKRGRIEYDSANNRLVAALYILGEGDFAKSVKGVSVTATKNTNENGTDNAIKIANLTAKGGMEDT